MNINLHIRIGRYEIIFLKIYLSAIYRSFDLLRIDRYDYSERYEQEFSSHVFSLIQIHSQFECRRIMDKNSWLLRYADKPSWRLQWIVILCYFCSLPVSKDFSTGGAIGLLYFFPTSPFRQGWRKLHSIFFVDLDWLRNRRI